MNTPSDSVPPPSKLYDVRLNRKHWGIFYGVGPDDVMAKVNASLGEKAEITLIEVAERVYAFVGTVDPVGQWRLSVVLDGETGHFPVQEVEPGEREAMYRRAAALNSELGLSDRTVAHLILQSMRSEGRQRP